jgi:hypothetical protein
VQRLVAVPFTGETKPKLAALVDEIIWLRVGQLDRLIGAFTERGIAQCVMLGQIAPKSLFEVRPDLRAVKLLMKLKEKNAHSIFGAIAEELGTAGVQLIEPSPWLASSMPGSGFQLGPDLSKEQRADVDFGFRIAKEISRLEIGQTVVVKSGTVLAVEGFEGTDACLKRGGELGGKDGGSHADAHAAHWGRFGASGGVAHGQLRRAAARAQERPAPFASRDDDHQEAWLVYA